MSKKILTFIIPLIILSGCSTVPGSVEADIKLIESYIQAVENKDYDTMESLLSEDYLGLGPSVGDSINKPLALSAWQYNAENLYEKIEYNISRNASLNINDGENSGSWVTNWAELEITYMGTQEQVTVWANTNYQIKNGQIIKSYTFYNEADVLRQLGFKFIDPLDNQ